ncbi:MAG TPA: hypothetical protein VLE89_05370, partial [Chlamydiales bacterium]|nr:hypothetical protein [Chlamydiales bacterium]
YLEVEGLSLDPKALFETIRPSAKLSTEEQYLNGRDLWRSHPALQSLLLRKLSPLAFALTGKNQLRLACDQWIPPKAAPKTRLPAKDLFSIQGLALCVLMAESTSPLPPSKLGLLPLPSQPSHLLFFKPTLLLDWPRLLKVPTDLYLAVYALPISVYVQNLKDPATNALKQLGYAFGDTLKNEFHPLIVG